MSGATSKPPYDVLGQIGKDRWKSSVRSSTGRVSVRKWGIAAEESDRLIARQGTSGNTRATECSLHGSLDMPLTTAGVTGGPGLSAIAVRCTLVRET
jgi:hypothetical protein